MPEYLFTIRGNQYRSVFPVCISPEEMIEALHGAVIAPPEPKPTAEERAEEIRKQEIARAEKIQLWLKKAKKFSAEQWDDEIYSPVEYGSNDGFFSDLGEYFEHLEDEDLDPEPFVWGTKREPLSLCADLILEQALEEMFDGAEYRISGVDELKAAIERFNEANRNVCNIFPDYTIAIILNSNQRQSEYRQALEKARSLIPDFDGLPSFQESSIGGAIAE